MTTPTIRLMKESTFREPMAVLSLRKYNELLEYLENIEDRLAIAERAKEETVSWEEVEKQFKKKFRIKK